MSIKFTVGVTEYTIKCGDYHSTLCKLPLGRIVVARTNFWGVNGVSEIVSPGVGPETIECDAWITDASFAPSSGSLSALIEYLQLLDNLRGSHGTLAQEGTVARSFPNCTFEGFQPSTVEGQQRPEPVQLINAAQWWCQPGILTWTQLKDEYTPSS
jgi:hypothetical protein